MVSFPTCRVWRGLRLRLLPEWLSKRASLSSGISRRVFASLCVVALASVLSAPPLHAQVAHTATVTPAASPPEALSGGTIQLDAGWADSLGDDPAVQAVPGYGWTDGGAGGVFLPSPYVKDPQYVAPVVPSGQIWHIVLQCQLECSVDPTMTATGTVPITVHGDPDAFDLSLAADALVIPSGGTCRLSISASDTWEHGYATWWSDAGVGGYFSPSQPAEADYTVRNTRGRDMPVVLSATADCGGWPPQYATSSLIITVQPDPHSFWVTVSSPQPAVLTGGGTSQLNATYTDWQGHGLSSWIWSDGGAGGVFSPSPDVPNPTYTVPLGAMAANTVIALTVTSTCDGPEQLSGTATTLLVVNPAAPGSYQVAGSELPIGMAWDESLLASVTCQNTGSTTWSPGSYQLLEDGQLGRWGAKAVDLTSPVPPGQSYDFAFPLTAPPLTTLRYDTSVVPPIPMADALDCSWEMALNGRTLDGSPIRRSVVVSRFSDVGPDSAGAWARPYIEECAGLIPPIVQGYEDGTYRPSLQLDRAAMAVYIARAMDLQLGPHRGLFRDVPASFWAAPQIEALYGADVVQGYGDGTYRPGLTVNRGSMAVFVARGIAGGDSAVPQASGPGTFKDLTPKHWAFNYVEYLAALGVVQGYPDDTYRAGLTVTRDQMAVFVYKGFIQSAGAAVVIGGPAITAESPETAGYQGWKSLFTAESDQPPDAYLILDAMRLGPELLGPEGLTGTWQVRFELRDAATPEVPAIGICGATRLFGVDGLNAAKSAALAAGIAYYQVSWRLPGGLTPGQYVLVVSAEDENGDLRELARRVPLTVAP